MKVYTYYEKINKDDDNNKKILKIWENTWNRYGWEPIILTEKDARQNPLFETMESKIKTFPFAGNPIFERACFIRWLPMAILGGVMTDWDVLNFGFIPDDLQQTNYWITNYSTKGHGIGVFDASKSGYEYMVNLILCWDSICYTFDNKKPNINDLHIFLKSLIDDDNIPTIPVCKLYRPFIDSPLVHFASFVCKKWNGDKDRLKAMTKFLQFRELMYGEYIL